jgi:hypothetical protein
MGRCNVFMHLFDQMLHGHDCLRVAHNMHAYNRGKMAITATVISHRVICGIGAPHLRARDSAEMESGED